MKQALFLTGLLFAILVHTQAVCTPLEEVPKRKAKKEKKEGFPKIEDFTKEFQSWEGLFTLYQDTVKGTTYLLVEGEQLDKEYIYFSFIADGVTDAGHFRGSYRSARVFSIHKHFNRIEFILENTGFYFDKDNPISKAAHANINRPVFISEELVAVDKEKKQFLIKADPVFLAESFQQLKPSPPSGPNQDRFFSLGELSKEKSKYLKIKSYPANTDVTVEYVYQKSYPSRYGSRAVTDARFISVKVQHSLIEMPDNDFQPRYDDPRVGFFTHQVNDMTSLSSTPYKDVVHRWHLVKKDPEAVLSEPVEPIVWWIENTTPLGIRETIKEAVLMWNVAFEKAGFKNAVEVKMQPDDADWDAGDLRYNVLRWTSSPNPPFGGYGPSFVNPRTGQILGADVMLEYVFLTNRVTYDKLYNDASAEQIPEIPGGDEKQHFCTAGQHLHHSNLFGRYALSEPPTSLEEPLSDLVRESLFYLLLHEVGHTLGLNHNMKSSQLHSPDNIHDKARTSAMGLLGSVMDYPAINISLDREVQGNYFTTRPGPYDEWAIEFAYSAALDDEEAEEKRLQTILSRSSDPKLMFGNDADDMRNAGYGLDPRVMIGDLSGDAISYSTDRMELIRRIVPGLKEKYSIEGQSYQELRNAYYIAMNEYHTSLRVISRYIGGVYVDRSFAGQENAGNPYTPVAYEDQKRAMKALADNAFSVKAFSFSQGIYQHLQRQRRGFSHWGVPEDPKIHDRVLFVQKTLFNHLLHPNVVRRLTDTELYGNTYSLAAFFTDLTDAIIKEDLKSNVNSFRQNVQVEYVKRLAGITKSKRYDYITQAQAFSSLKRIKKLLATAQATDKGTRAHREYMAFLIEKAMEVN